MDFGYCAFSVNSVWHSTVKWRFCFRTNIDSTEIKGIVTGKQLFLQWQMPGEYWRIKVTPKAYKCDLYINTGIRINSDS